jgi:SAM-dependent methyltransferase
MYRLFHEFANRYDLHTPPGHYQHDHAYVIREALRLGSTCRLLDVGCGTGVFLESALAAGINGHGIDASSEMVAVARRRIGHDRVRQQRMQEMTDEHRFDVVCALSWTIHYCETAAELGDTLRGSLAALRPGGVVILQVADDEQMHGVVDLDVEAGPGGEPDDTIFIHRFRPCGPNHVVLADYVYASRRQQELLTEQHRLYFTHPPLIAAAITAAGFSDVTVLHSGSVAPFVVGSRA